MSIKGRGRTSKAAGKGVYRPRQEVSLNVKRHHKTFCLWMLNHDELVLFLISARKADNLTATFERTV
jgi:hypothetical protein